MLASASVRGWYTVVSWVTDGRAYRSSVVSCLQCSYPTHSRGKEYAYIAHMNSLGNHGISVKKCGFIIHPVKGWIGVSPDGRVTDLTANKPLGLIAVKCPYTKREMTPMEACKDPNFYCKVINDRDISIVITVVTRVFTITI